MSTRRFSFLILTIFLLTAFWKCEISKNLTPNQLIFVPAPEDNPTTDEKASLGKKLFFDKRLSLDGTVSCATCHDPKKAFTDQLTTSIGIKGQRTERNAPSILNSGFLKTVMFDAPVMFF
jgi:cytochrome c peroxidase